VVIGVAAAAGLVVHQAAGGGVEPGPTALVAVAAVAGAAAGAGWGGRVSQRRLGRCFAVVVTLVALALGLDVLLAGGPPA